MGNSTSLRFAVFGLLLGASAAADGPDPRGLTLGADVSIHQSQSASTPLRSMSQPTDFFQFYRPTKVVPLLIDRVLEKKDWGERMAWSQRLTRGQDPFDALSVDAKVDYLILLEEAVFPARTWDGDRSLLLERRPEAPAWVDLHPRMQPPPGRSAGPLSFDFPRIQTRPGFPAASLKEALRRAQTLTAQTGLQRSNFEVFLRLTPDALALHRAELLSFLQSINDEVFLESSLASFHSVLSSEVIPWDAGHSFETAKLLDRPAGFAAPTPPPETSDPGKTSIAFHHRGFENGRVVISLEIRNVPEVSGTGEQDGDALIYYLNRVVAFSLSLFLPVARETAVRSRFLEPERAEREVAKEAKRQGLFPTPAIENFTRTVFGRELVRGALLPFSRPGDASQNHAHFVTEFVKLAYDADQNPHATDDFEELYRDWAREELAEVRAASIASFAQGEIACARRLLVTSQP